MTHTYTITGMTCSGCQHKVQQLLSNVPGVTGADIDLKMGTATIQMNKHLPTASLRMALAAHPKYQLTEYGAGIHQEPFTGETKKTWWQLYKPIVLIFAFITAISLVTGSGSGGFEWMRWMNHFMAGFFLVFSFFKLLDLKGFAENYAAYDVIARQWMGWGYIYAFLELGLGMAYLAGIEPLITNIITCIVMIISITGVLQSIFNKKKIQCACLGAVFNLPMSTVTIIEDASMIIMSAIMLFILI